MERQAYLQSIELSKYYNVTVFSKSSNFNLFDSRYIKFFCINSYKGKFAKEINCLKIFFSLLLNYRNIRSNIIYIHQFNLLTFLIVLWPPFRNYKIFIKIANSCEKFDLLTFFKRYRIPIFFSKYIDKKNVTYLCLNKNNTFDFKKFRLINIKTQFIKNGVIFNNKTQINSVYNKSIMYVGRIERVKKLEILFQLAILMKNYSFVIIGSGSLSNYYKTKYDHLDNILWLGELEFENIPWCNCSWLILPSRTEGMSNAILEAVANNKGIICQDIEANKFLSTISNKIVWLSSDLKITISKIKKMNTVTPDLSNVWHEYCIENVSKNLMNIFEN